MPYWLCLVNALLLLDQASVDATLTHFYWSIADRAVSHLPSSGMLV